LNDYGFNLVASETETFGYDFLDGQLISAPTVCAVIKEKGVITGLELGQAIAVYVFTKKPSKTSKEIKGVR
jgi:hypothetical protein